MTRQEILDEKRNVTSKISDSCRFIGFGLLAIYYTIRADTSDFAAQLKAHSILLAIVGIAGVAAVLLDYLQYLFGSMSVDEALKRETNDYDPTTFAYKGRKWTYRLKQVAVLAGSIVLVILVTSSSF